MLRTANRIRIISGMKRENELQYLRRRLAETVGLHHLIAKNAGVPQGTVSRIHRGADPRMSTAVKLLAYLRQLERTGSRIAVYRAPRVDGGAKPLASAPLGDKTEEQHDDKRSLANF